MKYKPKNCMKCGGKKMQLAGFSPNEADQNMDSQFRRDNQILQMQSASPFLSKYAPDFKKLAEDLPFKANKTTALIPNKKETTDWASILLGTTGLLSDISGRMERGRQDQYMYENLSALGQMNPMPTDDFQPNPYNLYMKKGGNLKTIMKEYQKFSNNAQMDMGDGEVDDKGMMKKGGYEIDRMLITRKILPELFYFGRMGSRKYKKQDGGRLVTEVPIGYEPFKKEGNRSYYQMNTSINPAQKASKMANPQDYEKYISTMVQSGISPEELANKGYISASNISKFTPFYKKDVVYTETQPDPTTAFRGEPVYEGNRLVGFSRYSSRNSPNQQSPGVMNTAEQFSEFMFADEMGKPIGDLYSIPATEWSNTFTGGTRHLKTREGLDKYKSPIAKFQKGGEIEDDSEEMIEGIAEILRQVRNKQNRRDIFGNVIEDFKEEGVDFDMEEFRDMSELMKGGININPENRGKFTAAAKKAGLSVQEMARKVLGNKEDYSPTMIKRANFARNAAKWNKEKGGLTPNKAREILHDGTAQGKKLTDKQRRFFGAMSKGHTNYK